MEFEGKLTELVSSHVEKINRDLNTPFYKSIGFWTSILSAIIAVASALYVYFDHNYGSEKRLNESIVKEQKNQLDLQNIDVQRKIFSAEKNYYIQDKKLSEKISKIENIKSLESNLDAEKKKVHVLEEQLKQSDSRDNRIIELNNTISTLKINLEKKIKEINDRPIEADVLESEIVNFNRDEEKLIFGELKITLMRVGNYKHNADFYYSYGDHKVQYKVLNLDIGDSVAREFGNFVIVIKVNETTNIPDTAVLKISRVKIK
ncbi:hypothetical protein MNBD_GAMMA03-2097 [hydrothermal vent metagenome]|uniref:Uncharacterized protein n=1 Tax=hydrothermal vent metagenome TaxID=652676 RepID=A0A3B0WXQ9_9ZZZZ